MRDDAGYVRGGDVQVDRTIGSVRIYTERGWRTYHMEQLCPIFPD